MHSFYFLLFPLVNVPEEPYLERLHQLLLIKQFLLRMEITTMLMLAVVPHTTSHFVHMVEVQVGIRKSHF